MLRWLTLLLGPIFAKEMVELARRKRYFFNRALYGVALFVALLAVWEDNRWRLDVAGPGAIRVQAEMAEQLFLAVSGVQYGAVILFVPLFLCGVVASEREEKTLDLLLTTQMTDREIVLGKLASRVVVLVLLIFSCLPVLSLCLLMGGIDPFALALVTVASLQMILFCGAHAIYFSTVTKTPIGALVRTYWWLAVWLVGVPLAVGIPLAAILVGLPWLLRLQIVGGAACVGMFVNPVGPFVVAMVPQAYAGAEAILGEWFFPLTLVLPSAWALFLIWCAVARLRGEVTLFAAFLRRITFVARLHTRSPPRLAEAWRAFLRRETAGWAEDPLLRRAGDALVGDVANPLWQRGRRARVYDRERIIGRIQIAGWVAALFFFIVLGVCEPREMRHGEVSACFLGVTWTAVALLTTLFAATSLVGDRRRGFLDQVLVTPLTGKEIIDGTLLAVWEHMRRVSLLPVVLGGLFCLTGASTPLGVVLSLITAAQVCALFAVQAIGCALVARSVPTALGAAVVLPLVVTIGTAWLAAVLRDAAGPMLWLLTVLALFGSVVWVRRRLNLASVTACLLTVHLALACAATCWCWDTTEPEMVIAALNPAFWVAALLQEKLTYLWPRDQQGWEWPAALLAYWLALGGSIAWARWWLIRNFDRLAGRAEQPKKVPMADAAPEIREPLPAGAVVNV